MWARRVWWLWIYLAGMGVAAFLGWQKGGRSAPTMQTVSVLVAVDTHLCLDPFFKEHGLPKDSFELARVLLTEGSSEEARIFGQSIVEGNLADAWGEALVYRKAAEAPHGYYLYSKGRNRTDDGGGGDDIAFSSGPPVTQAAGPLARATGPGASTEPGETGPPIDRFVPTMQLMALLSTVVSVLLLWVIVKGAWRAWRETAPSPGSGGRQSPTEEQENGKDC